MIWRTQRAIEVGGGSMKKNEGREAAFAIIVQTYVGSECSRKDCFQEWRLIRRQFVFIAGAHAP